MPPRRLAIIAVIALTLTGCASTGIPLPPAEAKPDYQLGGAYAPAEGVQVVARDRTAEPAEGIYSICYINGFQTQPGEEWPEYLLLIDGNGDPVIDPNWPDEMLLDTSTAEKRDGIARRIEPWIEGCAEKGFDAVEFDNLDTYARSDGALAFDDNLALAKALTEAAHDNGLAAAQKNSAEDAEQLKEQAGFDFAVVEECAVFGECDAYADVYGAHVIAIEYSDQLSKEEFDQICEAGAVLRDRDLTTPGDPAYVAHWCPSR
ncbi:endo alpha-1,4 polygalactosaminidase [Microbacterium sp.]|uniref:endo alpha-1,4 polygalactosaminidase n=1 Tax=Microbacterium sp. TaxID=51671 RepID=UPI003F71BD1E